MAKTVRGRPNQEQIDTALLWLRSNEGDEGDERQACEAVADWIEKIVDDLFIRAAAREAGIPTASLRQKLSAKAS